MATREEWNAIIEQEEAELFIMGLVEDIVGKGSKILYDKHIQSQILPYALNAAHEMIQDSINFYFYQRDPGYDPSLWVEDKGKYRVNEEFPPVLIDSWATGAVPVKRHVARFKIVDNDKLKSETEIGTSEKRVKKLPKPFKTINPVANIKEKVVASKTLSATRRQSTIAPAVEKNLPKVRHSSNPKPIRNKGAGLVPSQSCQSTSSSSKASRLMGGPRAANAAEIMIIRPPKGPELQVGGKSTGNITKDVKYKLAPNLPSSNPGGKGKAGRTSAIKKSKIVVAAIQSLEKPGIERPRIALRKNRTKPILTEEPNTTFPNDLVAGNGFEEDTRPTAPKLVQGSLILD